MVSVCGVCHEFYDEHVSCSCALKEEVAWMNAFVPAVRSEPGAHMGAVEMGG